MRLTPDPNSSYAGLYQSTGPGLEPDPDNPGMWLVTGPGLTPDPDHPGMFLVDRYVGPKDLHPYPLQIVGSTAVELTAFEVVPPGGGRPVYLALDIPYGQTSVSARMTVRTDLRLSPIHGRTQVRIIRDHAFQLDTVRGSTAVSVRMPKPVRPVNLIPELVLAFTDVRIVRRPDMSRNAPVLLSMSLAARIEPLEPLVSQ